MSNFEEIENIFKIEQILSHNYGQPISISLNGQLIGLCMSEDVEEDILNKIVSELGKLVKDNFQLDLDITNKHKGEISTNNRKQIIYVLAVN